MGDETSIFAGANKFLNAVKNVKGEKYGMGWVVYAVGERKFLVPFKKYANFFLDGVKCSTDDNFLFRHRQMARLNTEMA